MTATSTAGDAGSRAASDAEGRRQTWAAYLFMACEGYLIYAVGFITPHLQAHLGVSPWTAALPNSALALGFIAGGFVARRVVARIGSRSAGRLWSGLMAGSAVLLAIPLTIVPILLGAFGFGVAAAGMLVHVNSALAHRRGGTLIVRANTWSMVGGTIGPLVLSVAARTVGWSLGALVPIPLLVALVLVLPASPARDVPAGDGSGESALPGSFWLAWVFLVLCIGAEFSFVVWGAQVATARTGIAPADATALAALYVLGMFLGRLALSTGRGSGPRGPTILRASTVLVIAGAVVLWIGTTPAMAGIGLFVAGLAMAGIYPLAAVLALAHAPHAPVRASARLTAASGVAILSAPPLLGLVAGSVGLLGAWALVLGFLVLGLVVLVQIPRPAASETGPADVEAPADVV